MESFGALINDDDRDKRFQQLEARLRAGLPPDTWSRDRESAVFDQLRASLPTDLDRELFTQYEGHALTMRTSHEDAAYLIGVEVGRRSQAVTSEPPTVDVLPRDADGRLRPFTPEELMEVRRPTVEDILGSAIGALRLMQGLSALAAEAGDYTIPVEAMGVLQSLLIDAADQLTRLDRALPGRVSTMTVEGFAAESGGAA